MWKEERVSRHCRPLAGNLICSWQFNQTCENMFHVAMEKMRNRHSKYSVKILSRLKETQWILRNRQNNSGLLWLAGKSI